MRKVALVVVLAAALVISNGQAAQAAMLNDKQSEEIVRRYAAYHVLLRCADSGAFLSFVPVSGADNPESYVQSGSWINPPAEAIGDARVVRALSLGNAPLRCPQGVRLAKSILAPSSSTVEFMQTLGYSVNTARNTLELKAPAGQTGEAIRLSVVEKYHRNGYPTSIDPQAPGGGLSLAPEQIANAGFLLEDARYWMGLQYLQKECSEYVKGIATDDENTSQVTLFADGKLVTKIYQGKDSTETETKPCGVADSVSSLAHGLSNKYSRELTNAKKDAILAPLLDGMCSGETTGPTGDSQQDCRRKYREAFNACYVARTPGPAAGPRPSLDGAPILPTAKELAGCIARRTGGNLERIRKLVTEGFEASKSTSLPPSNITGDSTAATTDGGGESQSSCNISGGMGWLICPAISLLATISDAAFGIVSNHLTIAPKMLSTEKGNDGAYQAWSAVRTIANAGFVIIFLVVIFSHLTGAGGGRP